MSQQIVNCERGLLQGLISATFINIATKGRILITFKFTSSINTTDIYSSSTQEICINQSWKWDVFGRLNYTFHLFFKESSFVL